MFHTMLALLVAFGFSLGMLVAAAHADRTEPEPQYDACVQVPLPDRGLPGCGEAF